MRTVKTINKFDRVDIHFIIYEKDDDGLLMTCTVYSNNKKYKTNFSVDFSELDQIVSWVDAVNNIDLYELITSELLNSNQMISEIDLHNTFGKSIQLSNYRVAA